MKFKDLLPRIISALVVFGLLIGSTLWLGEIGALYFGILAVFFVQVEFARMFSRLPFTLRFVLVVVSLLNLVVGIWKPALAVDTLGLSILTLWIFGLIFSRNEKSLDSIFQTLTIISLGLLYTGFIPSFTLHLLTIQGGGVWFGLVLGSVFAGDIFAYFSGLLLGRRRLWELISPKKTWEGSIGGLVGSLFAGALTYVALPPLFSYDVSVFQLICVGGLAGIAGQIGDLFESLVKRMAGVKDSGGVMPGHGGVMDRIDGVLFGGVVVAIFLKYFVAVSAA